MSKPYFVRIKEIADLRNEYRIWKTHLLGDLSVDYKVGEINIRAWMVPLINPQEFRNGANHQRMVENKKYDFYKGRQVKIGIGQLPLLTPGTIFVDGFAYARPHYITAEFEFTVR